MSKKLTIKQVDTRLEASGTGIRRAPDTKYIDSKTLMEMVCHCDKHFMGRYNSIINGNTKSCGRCNNPQVGDKFGKLTITKVIIQTLGRGGCRVEAICDCGQSYGPCDANVITTGKAKSCGNGCVTRGGCQRELVDISIQLNKRGFSTTVKSVLINMKTPMELICKCGRLCKISPTSILNANVQSCGHCNDPLVGEKYHKFTIIQVMDNCSYGCSVMVRCDCGRTRGPYKSSKITSGHIKSCGQCLIPEIGDIYNDLTIIRVITNKYGGCRVVCKCKCGNTIEPIDFSAINLNNKKTCGDCNNPNIGDRYGQLTVTKIISSTGIGCSVVAKCDCGNEWNGYASCLHNGRVQSCGCVKSRGELQIIQTLQRYKIDFIYNRPLPGLGRKRFDFILDNGLFCIEYHGYQHYRKSGNWNFEQQKRSDQIKRDYCKANDITLYEIPYTYFDQLPEIIEDLVVRDLMWEFEYPEVQK